MDVLRGFHLRGLEQEKAGHPEFGHYIATGLIIGKSNGDALAVSINRLQSGALIPRHGGVTLSNDICTTDPYLSQPCPEKTSPDLSGDNLCFWKLRHTSTMLRDEEKSYYAMEIAERQGPTARRIMNVTFADGREVHAAPNKARHVCERLRDGERAVSREHPVS